MSGRHRSSPKTCTPYTPLSISRRKAPTDRGFAEIVSDHQLQLAVDRAAGSNECDTAAGRLGEESPQVRQLAFAPDEGGQQGRQADAMW